MWGLVLLVVVVVAAVLIARAVHQAQVMRSDTSEQTGSEASAEALRHRPRQPRGATSEGHVDEALAAHAGRLREAVAEGLITSEEAVGSIVRFTGGAWSDDAAARLLHDQDAA